LGDGKSRLTTAAATAREDLSSPTTLVTGPLDEAGRTAKIVTGNLPISSLSSGNKSVPNPLKALKSTVSGVTKGLQKSVQNVVKKVVAGDKS
jgi:hypothetical protein